MSAYHFKYFQNIQFKNHGIAPTPPYLPTLKAYPTPGVGGRFEIFSLKWRERMNLKVPGAILPIGCAILSTRAITVRGGWYNPPLGELGLINHIINAAEGDFHGGIFKLRWCRAWWIKPARLARTPIEISFVVGITVAVLMYFPRFVNQ